MEDTGESYVYNKVKVDCYDCHSKIGNKCNVHARTIFNTNNTIRSILAIVKQPVNEEKRYGTFPKCSVPYYYENDT